MIIAADWNCEPIDCAPVAKALISEHWFEVAQFKQSRGDKDAEKLTQCSTTHRVNTTGQRVDYFVVNKAMKEMIGDMQILEGEPLTNHFPILLTLKLPKLRPMVQMIEPTARYFDVRGDHEKMRKSDEIWDSIEQPWHDIWENLCHNNDAEHMWRMWNEQSELFLHEIFPTVVPGRAKGSLPTLKSRRILAKGTWQGAEPASQKRLRKLHTRLRRMRILLDKKDFLNDKETSELSIIGAKCQKAFLQCFEEEDEISIQKKIEKVNDARTKELKASKQARIKKWQEKMSSYSAACKWARGSDSYLTHLDTANGKIAIHPQDLLHEVQKRGIAQFTVGTSSEKREEFMKQFGQHCVHHHCELPDINPKDFKKFACRKRNGAIGGDGWHAKELEKLPPKAWIKLAKIMTTVESHGKWPAALVCSLLVGLKKPGPASKGVKLRLLRIMPRIMRGWSSLRCKQLQTWVESWAPPGLFGGIPKQGTDTASAPVSVAFAKATTINEKLFGASLDYTACFDNIDAELAIQVLVRLGLPATVEKALRALYEQIVCVVRVGSAASEPFQATNGIIQGCAMSTTMLNCLMGIWCIALKQNLLSKFELALVARVIISVYLDDRNMAASTVQLFEEIFAFSTKYDYLINSTLNESKCQVYSTAPVDESEYDHVLIKAERTKRPWSLGFTLPAKNGGDYIEKTKERSEKANCTARKVAALPHDMRERVLSTVHPTQYSYGREYVAMDKHERLTVRNQLQSAIFGNNRVGRSFEILWTVIYKGHAILPECVMAVKCLRLLFVIATKCSEATKDELRQMWHLASTKYETPVKVARQAFKDVNFDWIAPFKVKVMTHEGEHEVDISSNPWKDTMHKAREAMRYQLLQSERMHQRWDLKGLRMGIDFKKSRQNLRNPQVSWLRRGMMRTIMTGSCWTPSKMYSAGLLNFADASCVHCQQPIIESLGHRFWQCPKWRTIREAHGLQNFNETSWPRALTRCGICPANLEAMSEIQVKNIQLMMMEITESCSSAPLAEAQYRKARRPNSKKSREAHAYKTLSEDLVGHA